MPIVRTIFNDGIKQGEFDRNGWTTLPLLNEEAVEKLRQLYFSTAKPEKGQAGFYVGLNAENKEEVRQVRDQIRDLFFQEAGHHFNNIQAFTASYVVKEPNPKGVVPPHQDWAFTDETRFSSATVWIPLQDVNIDNGALGVINGSHRFFTEPRPSPSPQAKSVISDHLSTLFPWMQLVTLKAGEGLIFHNNTIHASPPNTGNEIRIAAGIGISQAEAPLLHYYQTPGSDPAEMICYDVDEAFFIQFDNTCLSAMYDRKERPVSYPVIKQVLRKIPSCTTEALLEMIKSNPSNFYNGELVEKMKQIFVPPSGDTKTGNEALDISLKTSIWKVYTFKNVVAEMRWRLSKFAGKR
jgi:hypothetical protein